MERDRELALWKCKEGDQEPWIGELAGLEEPARVCSKCGQAAYLVKVLSSVRLTDLARHSAVLFIAVGLVN